MAEQRSPSSQANGSPSSRRSALFARVRKCALEDHQRMEGFLKILIGTYAFGRAHTQQLEQLRDALPPPTPFMLCVDLLKANEIWWSLTASANCLMALEVLGSCAKTHMLRMRTEYASMYIDLLATDEQEESANGDASEGSDQQSNATNTGRSGLPNRNQLRLQVFEDILAIKEEEQASWRPNGTHMDWSSALLGSNVVSFPRTFRELLPIWPRAPGPYNIIDQRFPMPLFI